MGMGTGRMGMGEEGRKGTVSVEGVRRNVREGKGSEGKGREAKGRAVKQRDGRQ
jgi:hypothetical protein